MGFFIWSFLIAGGALGLIALACHFWLGPYSQRKHDKLYPKE